MRHNLVMWGSIFLIILAVILPITFVIFSCWWLLTGDMVSRLMWFNTSVVTTIVVIVLMTISRMNKDRGIYIREIGKENPLKKIYKKFFKF